MFQTGSGHTLACRRISRRLARSGDHAWVARWTSSRRASRAAVDVFDYDLILFPLHLVGEHWWESPWITTPPGAATPSPGAATLSLDHLVPPPRHLSTWCRHPVT